MSVTLTDEQARHLAALLRDLEAQPLLRPILRIRSALDALTRAPAPATDCENIERVVDVHGRAWERCTDREPDDLGTWCDWCRHRGVVQPVDDGSSPFPEPAPADADAGTGNSSKGTVPHAPRCAVNTEPGDTALTEEEEECCICGAIRPARCPHREALENLNDAYCSAACSDDGAHKVQCSDARAALSQPCAAPAGCQHRERLREAFDALPRECCATSWELLDRIEATLKQPCAAPGEAGDGWELWHCGNVAEDVQFFASQAPKDGPYRVYRRRAPEAKR